LCNSVSSFWIKGSLLAIQFYVFYSCCNQLYKHSESASSHLLVQKNISIFLIFSRFSPLLSDPQCNFTFLTNAMFTLLLQQIYPLVTFATPIGSFHLALHNFWWSAKIFNCINIICVLCEFIILSWSIFLNLQTTISIAHRFPRRMVDGCIAHRFPRRMVDGWCRKTTFDVSHLVSHFSIALGFWICCCLQYSVSLCIHKNLILKQF
jgi:hypothetical protein